MLCNPKHEDRFDRLTGEVRRAQAVTSNLFSNVIVEACMRLPALNATRLDQLTEVGAWSDAALDLIELELPAWKVRRLICEDGVWLCSLSRRPNVPIEFDDTADAYHEVLPLAILGAFVEARRRASAVRETSLQRVPPVRPTSSHAICCDNFT
jgi:hypothetical protein